MTRNPRKRPRLAFTLVELLVVIGIIAVLVGILLPALSRARESAITIQCMSNLRQFAIADQMYVNQYNWHMPGWWVSDGAPANTQAFNAAFDRSWPGITDFRKTLGMPILYPLSVGYYDAVANPATKPGYRCYVTKKWTCPDALRALDASPPGGDPDTRQSYYPIEYSYGMNVMGVDEIENAANTDVLDPRATQASASNTPVDKIFHGFKPSQVKSPGNKIHFADAMYYVINTYGCGGKGTSYAGWTGFTSVCNYNFTGERVKGNTVPLGTVNSERTVAWRHRGGANVIFFDGHGEWVRSDLFTSKDASGNIIRNDAIWSVMN